jgi:hypothetical protein
VPAGAGLTRPGNPHRSRPQICAAQDFEALYGDRLCEVEATDHLMVLAFDGKGIAMRLQDLREATRKKAEAARTNRTRTRLASGAEPNAKRMAEVAAVYSLKLWPRTLDTGRRRRLTSLRRRPWRKAPGKGYGGEPGAGPASSRRTHSGGSGRGGGS